MDHLFSNEYDIDMNFLSILFSLFILKLLHLAQLL